MIMDEDIDEDLSKYTDAELCKALICMYLELISLSNNKSQIQNARQEIAKYEKRLERRVEK